MKKISGKTLETGNEVNALALLIFIDSLKSRNITPEEILSDTGLTHSALKKFGARISWSDYGTVMNTLSIKCGLSRDDFVKIGEDALKHPLLKTTAHLATHIMSLPEMFETMQQGRMDTPGLHLINCIHTTVERGIDNCFRVKFKANEGYTMFPEFLYSTLGTIQALPTLYKLSPIDVDFEETIEGGTYTFYCPDAEKFVSKVRSFFSHLFKGRDIAYQLRAAFGELNRKNKEQQEQIRELKEIKLNLEMANRTKSDFVARISHELRTPLNGILGMNQLLSDQVTTEESRELVSHIDNSGHHLLDVINTILDFTRLTNNQWELRAVPFSPGAVLLELETHFRTKEHTPTIDFSMNYNHIKGYQFIGDSTAFHQIIQNLLDNAFKFTSKGTIKVDATATDNELAITVADTGKGIPQHLQHQIFDSFSQAEEYKTRHHEGTGIGLSITRKLVELMNGTISFDSTEGVGTWFEVTLPLKQVPTLNDPETDESVAQLKSLPKAKVLLAEDNRVNQLVIEKYLEHSAIELTVVEDGLEAVNAVSTEDFDLLLMDIILPIMSGEDATEAIRSIPHLDSLPIVALTANALEGDKERLLKLGMNGYLAKPVSRERLYNELKRLLTTQPEETVQN